MEPMLTSGVDIALFGCCLGIYHAPDRHDLPCWPTLSFVQPRVVISWVVASDNTENRHVVRPLLC